MSFTIAGLIAQNAQRWRAAKITRSAEFASVVKRLADGKARYQLIAARTNVPWEVIAVIHEREASGNWNANLAQGDPFNEVSRHVPAGRGPFATFGEAAYDALVNCAPHAAKWQDWSPGGALTILEMYNGLGYAYHDRPSPYVWSGTTIYDPPTGPGGKIEVDHGPIEPVTDHQLGCAGLLLGLGYFAAVPVPVPTPAPTPVPAPQRSLLQVIIDVLLAIFRKGK